jgi:hypothetical protein
MRPGALGWVAGILVIGGAIALIAQASKSPEERQAAQAQDALKAQADIQTRGGATEQPREMAPAPRSSF